MRRCPRQVDRCCRWARTSARSPLRRYRSAAALVEVAGAAARANRVAWSIAELVLSSACVQVSPPLLRNGRDATRDPASLGNVGMSRGSGCSRGDDAPLIDGIIASKVKRSSSLKPSELLDISVLSSIPTSPQRWNSTGPRRGRRAVERDRRIVEVSRSRVDEHRASSGRRRIARNGTVELELVSAWGVRVGLDAGEIGGGVARISSSSKRRIPC